MPIRTVKASAAILTWVRYGFVSTRYLHHLRTGLLFTIFRQVQSPHNSNGYFTIYGDETDYNDHFNAKLVTGCSTSETWARTGYLGFLRRTECSQAGSILDETTPSIASRDSDNESIHSQVGRRYKPCLRHNINCFRNYLKLIYNLKKYIHMIQYSSPSIPRAITR